MTTWKAREGYWTAYGRPKVPHGAPVPPDNWPPALGTYKPGPTTVGPREADGTPVAATELERYDGDIRVTKNDQVIEGVDLYGRIIRTNTSLQPIIRNCILRGPGPRSVWSSGWTAAVTSTSNSLGGMLIEDCAIDLTGRENIWVDGIREGNVTLRRTEITRTNDGLSLVSQAGDVTAEGCWIHNGYYTEWVKGTAGYPTQSDARSHGDGAQFQRGKKYRLRGNSFGGRRNPGKYHPSPYDTVNAALVAYKDAGTDYENSCLMIKQEASTLEVDRLDDVLIELNWFEGGAASINLSYDRGNTLDGFTIRDNRFVRSTWDAENIAVTGKSQIYIIRDTAIAAALSGNVFDDTGLAVPITKGITN